jgi:hypothetical protein
MSVLKCRVLDKQRVDWPSSGFCGRGIGKLDLMSDEVPISCCVKLSEVGGWGDVGEMAEDER